MRWWGDGWLRLIAICGALLLAPGCGGDSTDDGPEDGAGGAPDGMGGAPDGMGGSPGPGDEACDGTVSWANFAQGFVLNYCRGCHSSAFDGADRYGAPPGVDFDDRGAVLTWAERMRARAVDRPDMPPGGGPSDAERATFGAWLDCAPELDE